MVALINLHNGILDATLEMLHEMDPFLDNHILKLCLMAADRHRALQYSQSVPEYKGNQHLLRRLD